MVRVTINYSWWHIMTAGRHGKSAEIFHVCVRSQARVLREIPGGVIGIFVNPDGIGIPESVVNIGVVERSDTPVETVGPESLAVSSLQVKHDRVRSHGESPMVKGASRMVSFVPGPES
jgi:hypothetical protein